MGWLNYTVEASRKLNNVIKLTGYHLAVRYLRRILSFVFQFDFNLRRFFIRGLYPALRTGLLYVRLSA